MIIGRPLTICPNLSCITCMRTTRVPPASAAGSCQKHQCPAGLGQSWVTPSCPWQSLSTPPLQAHTTSIKFTAEKNMRELFCSSFRSSAQVQIGFRARHYRKTQYSSKDSSLVRVDNGHLLQPGSCDYLRSFFSVSYIIWIFVLSGLGMDSGNGSRIGLLPFYDPIHYSHIHSFSCQDINKCTGQ